MNKRVVVIMTDTTRKDMLGCYGNKKMLTPHLDRLAKEGVIYENAYTCQPVCGPARSALFTGTAPHSNGVVTSCVPLGDNVKTIGQRLTDNGIACGYIGKWHLDGGDYFGLGVCPEGWDAKYWYDMKTYLEEMPEKERLKSRQYKTAFEPEMSAEFTYAHHCSNKAIDFLEEYKDVEDFLLVLSYDEPHGPSLCPEPFNTMYKGVEFNDSPNLEDNLANKPLYQKLWAQAVRKKPVDKEKVELLLGCNSFVDSEIGRVLDKINKVAPDALIIFTSDHGDMLGSHRLHSKSSTAYEEITNVPLIIKGGAKGKIINYPASHIDITPTILDYMGLKIPALLEGRSMLSQIHNPDVKINDYVFIEFTRYEIDHDGYGGFQPMRAIVNESFKLVINLLDTDEFYDLDIDPFEMDNLIYNEQYNAVRNSMHDILLAQMNKTRDLYRGYQWATRPWRKDKSPSWVNDGFTRQRQNEEYEPRQLDYATGFLRLFN
ncbi:MAG: sulfatase [Epulopiscium sp. Nele67-Bin001]|nr:MAG: sulfatase [Epulopiscium sp. Nele67-Bin001]